MIFDVPKDKWEFREVDLTPFAGQRVAIEINIDTRMQSMNFRAIEIVSSDPPSEPKPDEKKPDDKKPGEKK